MTAATSPIRLRIRPFIVAYVRSVLTQNTAATSSPRAVEASGAVSSSPPAAPLVDLSTATSADVWRITQERMKQ